MQVRIKPKLAAQVQLMAGKLGLKQTQVVNLLVQEAIWDRQKQRTPHGVPPPNPEGDENYRWIPSP
jgi:hypothetical protein